MARRNRQGLAMRRTGAALGAGVAVLAVTLVLGTAWPVALAASWGVVALVIVVSVWIRIAAMDAAQTKPNPRAENFSRPTSDLVVLVASVASLGAIGYTVHRAASAHGATKILLIALAINLVALCGLTAHRLWLVRSGHVYYGDPVGRIDFNDPDPPHYLDFAYLAL